jgi:hypothetical protein
MRASSVSARFVRTFMVVDKITFEKIVKTLFVRKKVRLYVWIRPPALMQLGA